MADGTKRRGVVYDAQPLWLDAVERVLNDTGIEVVASTTLALEAVELVRESRPDLLVLGLSTNRSGEGVETIRSARAASPATRVVVLADEDDPARVGASFEAGAIAYVLKTVQPADLASAVRQAFGHSVYFAGMPFRSEPEVTRKAPGVALTRRETEILRLAAEGYSNGQLARMLWVTEQTVKFHLSNIYRKLNVANRTEASRWAQVHGLLTERSEAEEAGARVRWRTLAGSRT
ncbi:MAG TPA: response regulator transcription factor [Gaiellaceae bacterium]|nr:response regulator transcription factor [Gaiellaceae bacterium]